MKPILINLSPNTKPADVKLAAKLIFCPVKWLKGKATARLEKRFKDYFQAKAAFSFNTGRAALWSALKALNLKKGDQVLVQAFTCVVVPNAICLAGGQPVFVDTEKNSFNISITDLKKKINSQTKAIIVQHIFGFPDNLQAIKELCQKHSLVLIEDCAQSLGAEYQGKKVGTWGDLAMFSFGRDKMISSVNGGLLLVNNQKFVSKVKQVYDRLPLVSPGFVFKNLLHPLIFALVNPLYFSLSINKFSLGKAILFIFQLLGLVKKPVQLIELKGKQPENYAAKLPNAMAVMAEKQFKQLKQNLEQRQKVAEFYYQELDKLSMQTIKTVKGNPSYLRLPILVKEPDKLMALAKKNKVILGDWYNFIIAPKGVDFSQIGYQLGSCSKAERLSSQVVNLPTYPKMNLEQAKKVVEILKKYCQLYED